MTLPCRLPGQSLRPFPLSDCRASGIPAPVQFGGGEDAGAVGFQEAREIIICRKLSTHDFDPAGFLDPAIEAIYPRKDYHRMFIGEILALKVNRQ
jgi:hypothetical protein